jgi:choline kinase
VHKPISAKIYNNARMQLSSYVVSLTNEDSIDNEDISDAYNELDKYMAIMMGDIIYESSVFIDALYKIDLMIINSSNINIPKLEG